MSTNKNEKTPRDDHHGFQSWSAHVCTFSMVSTGVTEVVDTGVTEVALCSSSARVLR
jgi:hypothetical protein